MSLAEDLEAVINSEAYRVFNKAKGVYFDGMKLVYNADDWKFECVNAGKNDGFRTNAEELARMVVDIVKTEGLDALWSVHRIRTFTPTPKDLKGFATVVYGKKVAKQIKKNPRKSGKAMKKAFRGMF